MTKLLKVVISDNGGRSVEFLNQPLSLPMHTDEKVFITVIDEHLSGGQYHFDDITNQRNPEAKLQRQSQWSNEAVVKLSQHWKSIEKIFLTQQLLGDVMVILKIWHLNTCYELNSWALLVKLLSGECHTTPLIVKSILVMVMASCHQARKPIPGQM